MVKWLEVVDYFVKWSLVVCASLIISACGGDDQQTGVPAVQSQPMVKAPDLPSTQLLWGDTHLHTSFSADAYVGGNATGDPETAYRWAKGYPVVHPYNRTRVRIGRPLDFLAVTDHAEYAGLALRLFQGDAEVAGTASGTRFVQMIEEGRGGEVFRELVATVNLNQPVVELNTLRMRRSVWQELIDAAERHNQPGKFTALIGWEWSSLPNGANLHRVVLTPQGADVASRFVPFSAFDSDRPEDLWSWLESTSLRTGADFVAIPHNSNISDGLMFMENDSDGRPITAEYARERMRWEPVVEVTQIKGDSETHPALSPDDEFAEFETYDHLIKMVDVDDGVPPDMVADYARSGLKRGLRIGQRTRVNPYQFGMIGSTDSHTALSSAEEDNFWGKMGRDSTPENKDELRVSGSTGWDMSASGLAAVWATENTREAIIEAIKRREVYATSGTRISLRVFAGWGFEEADANARDLVEIGYRGGVPMGGEISDPPTPDHGPTLLIHALKDPDDANLDRVQVVKGWITRDGSAAERVFDVAWSDHRKPGPNGRLPRLRSTVDLNRVTYENSVGATQLAVTWQDPDFDPARRAFYYVRVLQIETPRNSLYDSVALDRPPVPGHAATIQERAYSSPIWYAP